MMKSIDWSKSRAKYLPELLLMASLADKYEQAMYQLLASCLKIIGFV